MKKFKAPTNNMAKLILNVNGKIIEAERPISDFIDKDVKVRQVDPPCKCKELSTVSTPSITPEIVFPYAMSMNNDFIKIGVVNDFDNKTRALYQTFDDGTVKPFNDIAIIGDDYGPIGMFVPFNANIQAIGAVAELFTDLYNSHYDAIGNGSNEEFDI